MHSRARLVTRHGLSHRRIQVCPPMQPSSRCKWHLSQPHGRCDLCTGTVIISLPAQHNLPFALRSRRQLALRRARRSPSCSNPLLQFANQVTRLAFHTPPRPPRLYQVPPTLGQQRGCGRTRGTSSRNAILRSTNLLRPEPNERIVEVLPFTSSLPIATPINRMSVESTGPFPGLRQVQLGNQAAAGEGWQVIQTMNHQWGMEASDGSRWVDTNACGIYTWSTSRDP